MVQIRSDTYSTTVSGSTSDTVDTYCTSRLTTALGGVTGAGQRAHTHTPRLPRPTTHSHGTPPTRRHRETSAVPSVLADGERPKSWARRAPWSANSAPQRRRYTDMYTDCAAVAEVAPASRQKRAAAASAVSRSSSRTSALVSAGYGRYEDSPLLLPRVRGSSKEPLTSSTSALCADHPSLSICFFLFRNV